MNKNEYFPKEHIKQILEYLEPSLKKFLGGKQVKIEFKEKIPVAMTGTPSGGAKHYEDGCIYAWIKGADQLFLYIKMSRSTCSFSEVEIDFLNEFFRAVQILVSKTNPGAHKAHFKTSLISSAFEVALCRFLREEESKFWTIQLPLQYLKDLSFMRYEGAPCTIGFLYSNEIERTLENLAVSEYGYRLKVWDKEDRVTVDGSFFDSILSYRYVDGIRSIFIIDNRLRVVGVLELPAKKVFTHIDFATHAPFLDAIQASSGKSFGVFVSKNSDINILLQSNDMIRWRKGRWTQVNKEIIRSLISTHMNSSRIDLLVQVIVSLSSSGQGAIILLPKDKSWDSYEKDGLLSRPVDGKSDIGDLLREFRLKRSMKELISAGVLISMLSTDGMTVISRNGKVIESSVLIKLGKDEEGSGGSRSAASRTASHYGLAIKVSEDGPIQMYKDGQLLIEIA